MHNPLIVNFI